MKYPDSYGHFEEYGGRFVCEELVAPLLEVEQAYEKARYDESFISEFNDALRNYAGRPTSLFFAKRLSEKLGGAKVYLKREDLCVHGTNKINSAIGQILLAKRMGKKRVVTSTGSGLGGVATTAYATAVGLECSVYMGSKDIVKQTLTARKITELGGELIGVSSGNGRLSSATESVLTDFMESWNETGYVSNSICGPHPYPEIVRDFQTVVGYETYKQIMSIEGRTPAYVISSQGAGTCALGLFYSFLKKNDIKLISVAGDSFSKRAGVYQGMYTLFSQDDGGYSVDGASLAVENSYPALGPEFVFLQDQNKISTLLASDAEAVAAYRKLASWEGILPSLESCYGLAHAIELAPTLEKKHSIVVCISGAGDKDISLVKEFGGE